jgi:hypothetical protein
MDRIMQRKTPTEKLQQNQSLLELKNLKSQKKLKKKNVMLRGAKAKQNKFKAKLKNLPFQRLRSNYLVLIDSA